MEIQMSISNGECGLFDAQHIQGAHGNTLFIGANGGEESLFSYVHPVQVKPFSTLAYHSLRERVIHSIKWRNWLKRLFSCNWQGRADTRGRRRWRHDCGWMMNSKVGGPFRNNYIKMGGKSNDQGGRKLETFRLNFHTRKSQVEQSSVGAAGTDVVCWVWELTMFHDSIFNIKLENIFPFIKNLIFFGKKWFEIEF